MDGPKAARVSRAAGEYLARRGLSGAKSVLLVAAVDMDDAGKVLDVRVLPLEC